MKNARIWILFFSCIYSSVSQQPLGSVEAKADYNRYGQENFLNQFRRHYSDGLHRPGPRYQWRGADNERGEGFPRHLNVPPDQGARPPPTFQREGGYRSEGELVDDSEIDALTRGAGTREAQKPAAAVEMFKVEARAQARQAASPLEQSRGDAVHSSSLAGIDKSSGAYFIALVAGCSAATVCGVIAAGFCWYKFQKNAKAAAEAEYPAYGVTGPNKDHVSPSGGGDRKLAHSAQMYHYQHQKQQMIAMEKNNGERQVSTSDLDSEDENEEGDYTVYECPGLAPTGDMEVKNPLFQDDPTVPTSPPVLTKPNDGTRQESTGF